MEKGEKTFLPNVQAGINTVRCGAGDGKARDGMDVKHAGEGDGRRWRRRKGG